MNWKGVSLHCQSRARTPTSTFSQSMKSASEEGKQSNQRKLAGHEHFYGWLRYNGYSLSGLSLMVWEEKWKVGNRWTSKPGPLTSSWQPQGTWTRDPYFELLKPRTLGLIPGGCYLPLSLCLALYHQTRVAVPGRNQTLFCCVFIAFNALLCRTSIKGGARAQLWCMNTW